VRRASPQVTSTPPARLDVAEVAAALTAFVNATVVRGRAMASDDVFEAAGVDSMGLLKVLLFVEERFGFWVPDDDLIEDNVASPRALASYICRARGSS
jgi:D-alanine--poly(phosphoribitol) ligase subunit 2